MNQPRKPFISIIAVVIFVAMITMACGLSVSAPEILQGAPTRPASRPTAGAFQNPSQNTDVTPSVTGQGSNEIPATGNADIGQLAKPVSEAPKNLEEIYDRSNPGVVSILTQVSQGGQVGGGAGSGFIITDNGYIATNHHVIEGATSIIVRFYNDADIEARVAGDDPNSDLAILKVDHMAEGATPLPMGDNTSMRVGDSVVAIGNPLALGTSMSSGIISALGRTIPSGFTPYNIPQAIQTDAAINPGNSGGPLINMSGEVIGINAQIRTTGDGGGNIGIGFAIPINILKQIYPSLIKQGYYTWPYLGVGSPAANPLSMNAGNTEEQRGALIATVEPGGPSDKAGLQEGDVVIKADGQDIRSFDGLLTYIAYKKPGDQIHLTVLRSGQQSEVTVTLGERPRETVPQQ